MTNQNLTTSVSKEQSIQIINDEIVRLGQTRLTEKELRDWDLKGGEPVEKLIEWARDIVSDYQTEMSEAAYFIKTGNDQY